MEMEDEKEKFVIKVEETGELLEIYLDKESAERFRTDHQFLLEVLNKAREKPPVTADKCIIRIEETQESDVVEPGDQFTMPSMHYVKKDKEEDPEDWGRENTLKLLSVYRQHMHKLHEKILTPQLFWRTVVKHLQLRNISASIALCKRLLLSLRSKYMDLHYFEHDQKDDWPYFSDMEEICEAEKKYERDKDPSPSNGGEPVVKFHWKDTYIHHLLEVYSANLDKFLDPSISMKAAWEYVAGQLSSAHGVMVSAPQCKTRMRLLRDKYQHVLQCDDLDSRRNWKFYEKMHEIFQEKEEPKPPNAESQYILTNLGDNQDDDMFCLQPAEDHEAEAEGPGALSAADERAAIAHYKWRPPDIDTLLQVYARHKAIFDDPHLTRKKAWAFIGRKMRALGVRVSGMQCKTRMRLLRDKLAAERGRGPRAPAWRYFRKMAEIFDSDVETFTPSERPAPVTMRPNGRLSKPSRIDLSPRERRHDERMALIRELERRRQRRHEERMSMDRHLLRALTKILAKDNQS